jgi:hypothetical protein
MRRLHDVYLGYDILGLVGVVLMLFGFALWFCSLVLLCTYPVEPVL